jgi:succinate dehydrogenase / fumarate reductase flavoprotein subunit
MAELKDGREGPQAGRIREEMQVEMMENVGIYRTEKDMTKAVDKLQALRGQYKEVRVQDRGGTFNTELLEMIELGNLLDLSLITAESARNRRESRGAHAREDYPERNDDEWLRHTLCVLEGDEVEIAYKEVDTHKWEPKPRVY